MPHKELGIQALLLRTFLPAVLLTSVALAILVYNLLHAAILDGFDRKLVTTSALTGAMINPSDHDWLMSSVRSDEQTTALENTPQYRRNVEPMQRIRTKLGLTYLYTQALGGEQDIFYILDSSLGDEHSQIGSEDDLPEETVSGLQQAQTHGVIYISPIEYQKQWGLLKTAAAPVYGEDGAVVATAGADVDISVIQVATQNALFASAIIGIVSIFACLLITLQLVHRVARPIETLKQEALRIAAGDHSPPARIGQPYEVSLLRDSLAQVTETMVERSTQKRRAAADHQRHADEQSLSKEIGGGEAIVKLHDNASALLLWAPTAERSVHRTLAGRAMTLLGERMAANSALFEKWRILTDRKQGACLLFDRKDKSLSLHGHGPLLLRLDGRDVRLTDGERRGVAAVRSIVIPSGFQSLEIISEAAI